MPHQFSEYTLRSRIARPYGTFFSGTDILFSTEAVPIISLHSGNTPPGNWQAFYRLQVSKIVEYTYSASTIVVYMERKTYPASESTVFPESIYPTAF